MAPVQETGNNVEILIILTVSTFLAKLDTVPVPKSDTSICCL